MLSAFVKAAAQLEDRALSRPLAWSLALAALVFAILWTAVWLALSRTALSDIGWIEAVIDALGGIAALVLTFILFPGVAAAILSFFLDGVIAAVEARHYPDLPPPRPQPLGEQVANALRFVAVVVGLNLAVLPIYLIPGVNLLVFYGMNGYLLGREYFEMVAPRRLEAQPRRQLWQRRRLGFILAGAVIAFISTLPLINLLAPVLAAAAMTHLVETYRRALPVGSAT
jgi:uncharacterized protein involved in cysteine biosynthesis